VYINILKHYVNHFLIPIIKNCLKHHQATRSLEGNQQDIFGTVFASCKAPSPFFLGCNTSHSDTNVQTPWPTKTEKTETKSFISRVRVKAALFLIPSGLEIVEVEGVGVEGVEAGPLFCGEVVVALDPSPPGLLIAGAVGAGRSDVVVVVLVPELLSVSGQHSNRPWLFWQH